MKPIWTREQMWTHMDNMWLHGNVITWDHMNSVKYFKKQVSYVPRVSRFTITCDVHVPIVPYLNSVTRNFPNWSLKFIIIKSYLFFNNYYPAILLLKLSAHINVNTKLMQHKIWYIYSPVNTFPQIPCSYCFELWMHWMSEQRNP